MKVNNQKPVILSPVYQTNASGAFDPVTCVTETLAKPLYQPMVQGSACTISSNGSDVSPDDITNRILACLQTSMDIASEDFIKELMSKCLITFPKNTPLTVRSLFAVQSAAAENLPVPTPQCIYTPATDVIPVSKEFLGGICTYDKYFATMAFYTRSETLGIYFANQTAFDQFKAWLATQVTALANLLPAQTNQLFTDFQALTLSGLTEGLVLRGHDGDNNDPYSFARTLTALLMNYAAVANPSLYGILPFDLGELFCPKTVVLINVDAHTKATAKQINDEWDIINKSLQQKPNIISNRKLQNLTAVARAVSKMQTAAVNSGIKNGVVAKAAAIKFKKTAPTRASITKNLMQIVKKMGTVARSENIYKATKMSYQRPNRRDPDDWNKMGKMTSTQYRPDLHVYVDTSGSISEENYEYAIKTCIRIAKKLNVNLYFNSFSDVISQCTKLNTKDRSTEQMYRTFEKVPKVTGGTDFEQVWNYINCSKKRRRELSLMITDFGYRAPGKYVEHPKNLYYAPCALMSYASLTRYAENFVRSAEHNDPNIRAHILM